MKKELGIFILLAVLCAITAIINPRFLAPVNLQNTARLIGAFGILSLGLGAVIITSGIDLSVGSVLALLGVLLSMAITQWHIPGFVAVLLIVVAAMGLGVLHGFLVAKVRIQPFIVTLCGLLFYRGAARFIASDETKGFGNATGLETLQNLAIGNIFGIPTPFVLLLVLSAVMWVLIHRSIYGRYLFAVGNNEDAARYSGINARLMIASAYVVCGALTGIAAVIFAFYTNSVSPSSHGNFFELYGIAAAVLGGCSLRGGEGSVIGILLGTALLQVLQNLVNLIGIPSSLNFAVMGAVILLGVLADQLLKQRKVKA
ncbi:MAG: ABC transporter permease [Blastocatellia bacterium]